MRIIDLTLKDLLQVTRDWRAALFLIAMPIGFTIMFGFAFGGFGDGEPTDSRLPVGVMDQDLGSLSSVLISILDQSKIIAVETVEVGLDEAGEMVADNDLAAVIIIPQDYSQKFLDGDPPHLDLIVDQGTPAGNTVSGEVNSAAMRLNNAVQTATLSSEIFGRESGFSDADHQQRFFDETVENTIAAWENPPITISAFRSTLISEDPEDVIESGNAYTQSSPGMMAQFAIAGLMGASAILVIERKNQAMRRLLTTAITRVEILLGHYLAMFVMIFAQLMMLILFGQLLLRLDYFGHPAATILLAVSTALFAASLGLLIGALAKSEDQVIVFAMVPMFLLSGLGGAWVP
jgi:ABC-2 type transport system permease protein